MTRVPDSFPTHGLLATNCHAASPGGLALSRATWLRKDRALQRDALLFASLARAMYEYAW